MSNQQNNKQFQIKNKVEREYKKQSDLIEGLKQKNKEISEQDDKENHRNQYKE